MRSASPIRLGTDSCSEEHRRKHSDILRGRCGGIKRLSGRATRRMARARLTVGTARETRSPFLEHERHVLRMSADVSMGTHGMSDVTPVFGRKRTVQRVGPLEELAPPVPISQ